MKRYNVPLGDSLRILRCIAIVSLLNSLIGLVPFLPGKITTWISRGVLIATIGCMFLLSAENKRYRYAAVLRTLWLAALLAGTFLHSPAVLVFGSSVLSFLAVYQEYSGHGELVADQDLFFSKKWKRLFLWSVLTSVLLSAGSTAAMMIASFMALDVARVTYAVTLLLRIPEYVFEVLYICYLGKTAGILSNQKDTSNEEETE